MAGKHNQNRGPGWGHEVWGRCGVPSCGREVAYHLVAVWCGEQGVSASMSSDELTAVMEVMD